MPSAIVTGATGILGRETVFALAKDKSQWQTIHALSRSQKEEHPSNVKHDHIDLTSDAQTMAKQLEGVEAEYVFFAAYLQKDSEEENSKVNGAMLKNFIDALEITGAIEKVRRFILTTGAKQYGVHLEPVKNPMEESDPWITGSDPPPNFYYTQQEILKLASKKANWDWVVTYPNDVTGVTKGNFMNLLTTIALYALVCKRMNKNAEMPFPGSQTFYTKFDCFTYAPLHAEFNVWAATTAKVSNQAFNVVNGDVESWQELWPMVARRFGCTVPADQFKEPLNEDGEGSVMKLAERPPIDDIAKTIGVAGDPNVQRQGKVEQRVDLMKWSQRDDVKKAWNEIAEENGLEKDAFEKATWMLLGFVLGRDYDIVISMSKARKYEWTGYKDTWEAFQEGFEGLEEAGIIPKGSGSEMLILVVARIVKEFKRKTGRLR